jgi:hypothetical protein
VIEAPTRLVPQTGQKTLPASSLCRTFQDKHNEAHPPGCAEHSATTLRRDWSAGTGLLTIALGRAARSVHGDILVTASACLASRGRKVCHYEVAFNEKHNANDAYARKCVLKKTLLPLYFSSGLLELQGSGRNIFGSGHRRNAPGAIGAIGRIRRNSRSLSAT